MVWVLLLLLLKSRKNVLQGKGVGVYVSIDWILLGGFEDIATA